MSLEEKIIVAIDDTPSILTFLRVSLQDEGATFFSAHTAMEGLELCREKQPDLIVLDLGLPDMDGLDVLHAIKQAELEKEPIVIILSVRKNQESFAEANRRGAAAYLTKPFMVEDLIEVIEEQLNGN